MSLNFNQSVWGVDGSLWAFGDNQAGQLALGDTVDRNKPTQITCFQNLVKDESMTLPQKSETSSEVQLSPF